MGWTQGLAACPVTAVWKAPYLTTAQRKDSVTVYQVSLENSVTGVYMASMHSRMVAAHVSTGVPYVPRETCPVPFLGVIITSVNVTFLLSLRWGSVPVFFF